MNGEQYLNIVGMLEYLIDEYGRGANLRRGEGNHRGRPGDDPPHGTHARYVSKRLRCRCEDCTTANTAYIRALRGHGQ